MLELTVSVLFSMAAHEQALSCSPQVEPAAQPELNITGPGGWPGTAGGAVIVGKKSIFNTGSRVQMAAGAGAAPTWSSLR